MGYYGLIIPPVFPIGVFIQDIKQTKKSDESEGVNTMTVTLTNQQKTHFNIKNGKQGSSAEATAQMEQHAKEYISTELKEQKLKLEQEISKASNEMINYTFYNDAGFLKFKNNLIIQFFKIKSNGTNINKAEFPLPFPNKVLTITSSLIVDNIINNPNMAATLYIWDKTKDGFCFSSAIYSESLGSSWSNADYDIIAIGY